MQGPGVLESWLPDWLPSLSSATVTLDGEPPYSFHLAAEAALDAPHTDAWVDTEGRIGTTPEGFETSGALSFEPPEPRDEGGLHEIEVDADGDEHVLHGSHVFPGDGVWRSRETAERAAVNAVEGFADSVEVEADVEVRSYTTDEDRVELEYAADLEGLEQGVAHSLHRWFGSTREVEETELDIDRVSVEKSSHGGETSYSWEVDIDGHLALSASLADAAGWSQAEDVAALRRQTDFGVESNWSLYMGDDVDLSLEYDTTNGGEYVDALRSAGVEHPSESELRFELDSGSGNRFTELRYTSESGAPEDEELAGPLERWMAMAPAPVLPAITYYVSR